MLTPMRTASARLGTPTPPPTVNDTPEPITNSTPSAYDSLWDGDKFLGGFGITRDYTMDYGTLQARSAQLFEDNLYARGLVRRLVTNIITTGLELEAQPNGEILGIGEDKLADWTENQESRFSLYGANPNLCDFKGTRTLGQLQASIKREAILDGDVLIILHQDPGTGLPKIQVVKGGRVLTPLDQNGAAKAGNTITHGVELDSSGRQVAYHVQKTDKDGMPTTERVPAWGPRSGRRVAWLVYGNDKREDDVRGTPLLGLILQSLKEIDRYRDSTQRKATINSIIAAWVEKTQDKMGTLPITNGANRTGTVTQAAPGGTQRKFNLAEQIPGVIVEELQQGEKPTPYSTNGTDVNFGTFEKSIVQAIAWCYEIPPEILTLSFSSNYSASQAAINEFTMFLTKERTNFGSDLLLPVYVEWFVAETLSQKVTAPGFLESRNDPTQYDTYTAWTLSSWAGAVKPSANMINQTKGYKAQVDECWTTNDLAARELSGTKFSHNVKRVARENKQKADAMRPLLELEQEFGPAKVQAMAESMGLQ